MEKLALKYAPTLVIGVKGDNGQATERLLENVRGWLSAYYPQVIPIVRFGMADGRQLVDMTERIGETVGDSLAEGLRKWLEAIAEARRLEEVKKQGIEVVGVERVNRRIILFLSPNCLCEPTLSVLRGLSEASKQFSGGVQVLALVIAGGARPDLSSLPLKEWQEAAQGLLFAKVVVLHRHRSDGSTVDAASLPVVLQFLLLTALAPYESDKHWLFETQGDRPMLNTVGIGVLYVPVTQIAEAAGNYLAFQLSRQAMGEQAHPKRVEWEGQLKQIFDENTFWQSLFAGIEEVAEAKVESQALPEEVFRVALKSGLVRMDLSKFSWWQWRDRLADYEMKWRMLLRDFWLPRMQENAERKQQEAEKEFQKVLDTIVQEGEKVFATVENLMEQLTKHLKGWRCDDPQIPRGIVSANVNEAYEALEKALENVPNPRAIVARLLLSGAVIAYVTFALARWSWLAGFVTHWLQNFFPSVEAWMVPAFIGLAGFLAFLRITFSGFNTWREAHEQVERAKEMALEAIEGQVNSVLREMGLQLLTEVQQNFLRRVKEVTERNRRAREGMERLQANWKAKAEAFDAQDTPMTRAVIRSWSELQPIIDERMQGQNWSQLWIETLKSAPIQTFAEWCDRIEDGTAEEQIAEAAETLWREKLQGEEMQRLSFYLKPHEQRDKVKAELQHCYEQAKSFLWSPSSEHLRWQLKAEGEEKLNELVQEVLKEKSGQDWQTLTLPAIAGFLRLGRIEGGERL